MGFEKREFSAGNGVKYVIEVVRENNLETVVVIERHDGRGFSRDMVMSIDELGLLAGVATGAYIENSGLRQMEISPADLEVGDVIEGLGPVHVLGGFEGDGRSRKSRSAGVGEIGTHVLFTANEDGDFDQQIGVCRPIPDRDAIT